MMSVKSQSCWKADESGNLIEKLDKLVSSITCKDTNDNAGPADVYEFTEDDGFDTNEPMKEKANPSLKLKVFSCEYCKKYFTRKSLWLKHRKSLELFF